MHAAFNKILGEGKDEILKFHESYGKHDRHGYTRTSHKTWALCLFDIVDNAARVAR